MWFSIQHGVTACNGGLRTAALPAFAVDLFAAFYCTVLGGSIAAWTVGNHLRAVLVLLALLAVVHALVVSGGHGVG
jgi:hypothetical protein